MTKVIEVKELSKKYRIYHAGERSDTLRDSLLKKTRKITRPLEGKHPSKKEDFWALKDLNFTVGQGEVLGVIGLNGSGKSTLLKILSRITPPSAGQALIHGRVASLLEVGTGFHAELTGRENIYLNGAILGMSKSEIENKFEKIVAFSGVEKFIDTPVKRYSSGMSVRLAFAVAAHLEPEILLIDEVLAVGDSEFQNRCLGKMDQITQGEGRTVVFVSHNMDLIQKLCNRTIWLEQGKIREQGPSEKVVADYLDKTKNQVQLDKREDRKGKGSIRLTDIKITNLDNQFLIKSGDRLKISVKYKSKSKDNLNNIRVSLLISNEINFPLIRFSTDLIQEKTLTLLPEGELICETEEVNLRPGYYKINAAIFTGHEKQDHVVNAASFDINGSQEDMNIDISALENTDKFLIPHHFYQKK